MKIIIKFKKLYSDSEIPKYMTNGSSGMDIKAYLINTTGAFINYLGEKYISIQPGERIIISTGLSVEIPNGYEIQIRPRSGLSIKNGITILNTPGTIDSDYRGEIKVILINLGEDSFNIIHGERIAQLVVMPIIKVVIEESNELDKTERDKGGFGSTGK